VTPAGPSLRPPAQDPAGTRKRARRRAGFGGVRLQHCCGRHALNSGYMAKPACSEARCSATWGPRWAVTPEPGRRAGHRFGAGLPIATRARSSVATHRRVRLDSNPALKHVGMMHRLGGTSEMQSSSSSRRHGPRFGVSEWSRRRHSDRDHQLTRVSLYPRTAPAIPASSHAWIGSEQFDEGSSLTLICKKPDLWKVWSRISLRLAVPPCRRR
jgi:hypothetical protein